MTDITLQPEFIQICISYIRESMYDILKKKDSWMAVQTNTLSMFSVSYNIVPFLYNIPPPNLLFRKQLWTGSQDIIKYFQTLTK